MKSKGLPFIWQIFGEENKEFGTSEGIYPSLLANIYHGNFKGIKLAGVVNFVKENSSGFNIAGLINASELVRGNYDKGINISGLGNLLGGDSEGIKITGGVNFTKESSKGVDISGVGNYSSKVNDFLIQYGTIGNIIKKYSDDAFVFQIGLYNKIGDQHSPIVNLRGLKNLPKQIKKIFSKESNLKKKLNP